MIIDAHAHTLCPAVNARVGQVPPGAVPYQRDMSDESRAVDTAQGPVLGRKFNDLATRLEIMAGMGVDHQVVAPAPGQQHYWAAPEPLAEISRMQNDHVAALVAQDPARLTGLGTLPLTHVPSALAEAQRAVEELGLRGFQIDSRAGDRELSDPALDPLYALLARLGVPLVIHPLGFSHGQRLSAFFMINTVGQPLEEIIAAQHFILGGVLDRHPALKVLIVHGGGYFPYYLGRLDHAWRARPELRRLTAEPPSAYLRRFWYDTCVFDPAVLARLVALAGADRVMLGSDCPFDMGDPDPVGLVERGVPHADDRAQILGGTARVLFGIAG